MIREEEYVRLNHLIDMEDFIKKLIEAVAEYESRKNVNGES